MQVIIAAEPKDIKNASAPRRTLAHIAYKIGGDGRLYRAEPASSIDGGYMVLSSDTSEPWANDASVTEIINECKARHFLGVLANFDSVPFLGALAQELSEQKLRLIVPEPLANEYKNAWVLVSSALSGGTLRRRLTEAISAYGASRILLDVEKVCRDFSLPAPSGEGKILTQDEFNALVEKNKPATFFSYDLCCNYFSYFENDLPHIVLYDDLGSIKNKLFLAESARIDKAIFVYSESSDIIKSI